MGDLNFHLLSFAKMQNNKEKFKLVGFSQCKWKSSDTTQSIDPREFLMKLKKTPQPKPAKAVPKENYPMPSDPKDLARAMFVARDREFKKIKLFQSLQILQT